MLYSLWAWTVMGAGITFHVLFLLLTQWVIYPAARRKRYASYTAHLFLRAMGLLADLRIHVKNQHYLDRPAIIIANHSSHFDILAIMQGIPNDLIFVARESLFKIPILGQEMRLKGDLSINRTNKRQSLRVLNQIPEIIAAGRSVVVFPEGTRSPTGALQPFHKAIFSVAHKHNLPIIPLAIMGSNQIITKNSLRIYRKPATLSVLPVIMPSDYTTADDLSASVHQQIDSVISA